MQAIVHVLPEVAQRTPLVRSSIHVDQPVAARSLQVYAQVHGSVQLLSLLDVLLLRSA